jgi:hypothetical protein
MLHFQKAREAQERIDVIRRAILEHEHLSSTRLRDVVGENGGRGSAASGKQIA